MQKAVFQIVVKQADASGTFVGFANTYGNEDLVGDVVDRGAFSKTISHPLSRGAPIPTSTRS